VTRAFLDTSILIRYFAEDDVPRAVAAAELIDSATTLVVSTGVIIETVHVLRTEHRLGNPALGEILIGFLRLPNVELSDADKSGVIAALHWTQDVSARRITDAITAGAAEAARADFIATFDERMASPTVPVRLL
jgi:predicted nucleic acid-binding protein